MSIWPSSAARPPNTCPTSRNRSSHENDSPDVGFRYSVNPYRGCAHGCSYCYARPTHEYLGLTAGLDFETKVFVKYRAAELLREFLAQPSWQARNDRLLRRHRLLPAGRARVRHHPRLRRRRRRMSPADRHHHQECARRRATSTCSRSSPLTTRSASAFRSLRSTPSWPAPWSRAPARPTPGCAPSAN